MQLEKLVKTTKLFEIYQNCFNAEQKDILTSYLVNDLQLTEIAEIKNVSRQAIYKIISTAIKKLEKLEEQIGFYQKIESVFQKINQLENAVEKSDVATAKKLIQKIKGEF